MGDKLTSDRLLLYCGSFSACSSSSPLSSTSPSDSDSRRLLMLPLFRAIDGENQLTTFGNMFDTRDFTFLISDCNEKEELYCKKM